MYPCIPSYCKLSPKDPFDYKLRSGAEVAEEMKYFPPNFEIKTGYKKYVAGDTRPTENTYDNRERVAKISLDMRDLKLAPLQRRRMIFLLGPRYNPAKPHHIKIVYSQYNTFQENYQRCYQTLREIFWESKRAPAHIWTFQNNPYRREKIIKKLYGRTAEERNAKRRELNQAVKDYKQAAE